MQKLSQRTHSLTAGLAIAAAVVTMSPAARAANAADCPNDGVVRFGVEPFDTSAKLVPIYDQIGKLLGEKIGCEVKVYVATNYNAEIEAMRSGKLEIGEFGPLGYVLAHQVAKAQAVAAFSSKDGKPDTYWASLVTYPGSGIKTVAEIRGHSFAFSDPASTSGHLFPAYGLRKAGIDPDKDIKALYAGSHTASYRGAVQPQGRCRRTEQRAVEIGDPARPLQGRRHRLPVEVRPDPDRPDHRARRSAAGFKARLTKALQTLDLSALPEADRKIMGLGGDRFVPQTDAAYDGIRDLVKTLNIDLDKLS